jgi:putative spermidine/putrescine transport system permease protein
VPVTLVLLVVGTGLGATALQSLGLMPLVGQPRLTFGAYTDEHGELLTATGLSLLIATASTVVAAVIGLTTAVLAMGSPRARRLLTPLVTASVPVPHLVGAASVGLLLADGGLLSRWLGTPEGWPDLVAGRWPTAIVLEYAWKESAFIALVVTATLAARLPAYQETAALLGARPWARFRHVTLPLAAPALGFSSAITFVYTLGSYEVAWLLGPAYPEPLPVMAYRLFTSTDLAARPQAMALAMTTTALAGVAAVLALALVRRTAGRR